MRCVVWGTYRHYCCELPYHRRQEAGRFSVVCARWRRLKAVDSSGLGVVLGWSSKSIFSSCRPQYQPDRRTFVAAVVIRRTVAGSAVDMHDRARGAGSESHRREDWRHSTRLLEAPSQCRRRKEAHQTRVHRSRRVSNGA
jgi:hypothetical protein